MKEEKKEDFFLFLPAAVFAESVFFGAFYLYFSFVLSTVSSFFIIVSFFLQPPFLGGNR